MQTKKIENLNSIENNIKQIKNLFNVFLKVDTEFKMNHKYIETDVRISAFQKCMILFRNMYINLKLAKRDILTDSVYDLINQPTLFAMSSESIIFEYINCSKISMQLIIYSCIESTLRPIYVSLKLGNEHDRFSKVFKKIVNELKLNKEYIDIMTILSNIRNTVHNNGVFIDPRGENYKIEYKGYTYEFIHNQGIGSVWISNLTDLYRGIVNFYKEIFNHEKILNINFIQDKYAAYMNNIGIDTYGVDDLIYANIYSIED